MNLILPFLSFASFITLMYFSISVLRSNPRAHINRSFFVMTMSWSLIAFSYSFMYATTSAEQLLMWTRIASAGWFIVPGATLHATFFLVKKDSLGLRWWIYPLLYLPGATFLARDCASSTIILGHMTNAFGASDQSIFSFRWFIAFVITSFAYFASSLGIILHWFVTSTCERERTVAGRFLVVGIPILIIGTITDGVFPVMHVRITPPLASVLIAFWVTWIWLAIIRYQVLDITPAVIHSQILPTIDRYQTLMDNFMDIVWTMDLELRLSFASASCLPLLGYAPDEMLKLPLGTYIASESVSRSAELLSRELEIDRMPGTDPNRSILMDVEYVRRDGTTFWAEVHAKFIRTNGVPVGLIGISRDISKRKEAEDKLMQSEEKYRELVEHAGDIIYQTDRHGFFTYINPTAEREMRYNRDALLGRNFAEFIPAEHRERLVQIYADQYRSRTPSTYTEMPISIPDGGFKWFGQNVRLLLAGDRIVGFHGIARDITERKRIQDQLRLRTETLERDLSNAQIIQQAMLPNTVPHWDRLKIQYRYRSLDKIGGDFFSFIKLQEGGMGIFIGDVSGHGVSAALFLSLLKADTDHVCREYGIRPGELLERMNEDLVPSMPHHFVTAIYGHFLVNAETDLMELSFSNGGHPNPIIQHRETGEVEFLRNRGIVLGKFRRITYRNAMIELRAGDRVYFYTDGIPESRNRHNDYLGFDELPGIIRSAADASLERTLDGIMETVDRFRDGRPPEDDMVLIGCEVA